MPSTFSDILDAAKITKTILIFFFITNKRLSQTNAENSQQV